MTSVAVRSAIRKALTVTLALTCLAAGYLAHGVTRSPSSRPVSEAVPSKVLTASDLLLIASTAEGIHLRYAGVSGPPSADHANDIPIEAFSFGVARSISGPPAHQPSAPSISEITLSRTTDQYSAKLLNLSLRGTSDPVAHTPLATLFFTDLSGVGGTTLDYLRIDLQEVLISSFSMSSGGFTPSESISLSFSNVMTFTYHIPAGTTQTVTYNLVTQT